MRAIGMQELLVICGIAVLLFGGKRIGELGKGVGESLRHLKKAVRDVDEAKREAEKL
jgi:sec-independent protein translocase protein TatA